MDIKALKLDDDCLTALDELRELVESNEQRKMYPSKSMKELVDMVEVALRSTSAEVNFALLTFVALLSDRQRMFFKSVGTDLSLAKKLNKKEQQFSYRGAKSTREVAAKPVDTAISDDAEMASDPQRKKRKIIYRGQEKWV